MTANNVKNAMNMRSSVILLSCVLCLSSCATQQTITPLENLAEQRKAVSEAAQDMTIALYAANKDDQDRWYFYQDFAEKGYVPLQIEINNPTEHTFTLGDTQYAICDPAYKRTRRTEAKDMALTQVEIMTEGKRKWFVLGWIKDKMAANQMKKGFQQVEFETKEIPPLSTIRGWLYFKMQEGRFDPSEFYKDIETYELEIAHIKNSDTNVVTNFYLPLAQFTQEFHEQ
jgi:hypothetical protein